MNLNEAIQKELSLAEICKAFPVLHERHLQNAVLYTELKFFRFRNLIRCWQEGLFPPAADTFHQPTETYRKEHLQECNYDRHL